MEKITIIILSIFSFLFLHSELGLLKNCPDHHKNHDVCEILRDSDNIRTFDYNNFSQNLHMLIPTSFYKDEGYFELPNIQIYYLLKSNQYLSNPPKIIILLKTLLI